VVVAGAGACAGAAVKVWLSLDELFIVAGATIVEAYEADDPAAADPSPITPWVVLVAGAGEALQGWLPLDELFIVLLGAPQELFSCSLVVVVVAEAGAGTTTIVEVYEAFFLRFFIRSCRLSLAAS
jgi:hypothetical protein